MESSTQAADKKIWLNGYEIASRHRLRPVEHDAVGQALFAAAKAGELTTPDGVNKWTQSC